MMTKAFKIPLGCLSDETVKWWHFVTEPLSAVMLLLWRWLSGTTSPLVGCSALWVLAKYSVPCGR